MARERYLVDMEEDTIHSNQIVLTDKKDIRKNWWHYHKKIVFACFVAAALVASFIYSMASKVHPDYTVGLLTSTALPENLITELQEHLQQYAEDLNGDGKALVQINSYVIGDPINDQTVDPNMLQAAMVRFTADASENESMLFLHDEKTFNYLKNVGFEGFFRYNDGRPMAEDATDFENAMLAWDDVAALAEFKPESLNSEEISQEDVLKILQRYRLSFRNASENIEKKPENMQYYQQCEALLQRFLRNEKISQTNGE